MIDILEFNEQKKTITYICQHCSDMTGHWVKTTKHIGEKIERYKQFAKEHEKCGEEEDSQEYEERFAKFKAMFPEWEDLENRVKWVMEHEGLGYLEAKAYYILHWAARWDKRPAIDLKSNEKNLQTR